MEKRCEKNLGSYKKIERSEVEDYMEEKEN